MKPINCWPEFIWSYSDHFLSNICRGSSYSSWFYHKILLLFLYSISVTDSSWLTFFFFDSLIQFQFEVKQSLHIKLVKFWYHYSLCINFEFTSIPAMHFLLMLLFLHNLFFFLLGLSPYSHWSHSVGISITLNNHYTVQREEICNS